MTNEPWFWRVTCHDGSVYDELSNFKTLEEIGWNRIRLVEWVPLFEGLPNPKVSISPDMRPIIFRRVVVGTETGGSTLAHVIGWQKTVNGKNVKSMLFLNADGTMVMSDESMY